MVGISLSFCLHLGFLEQITNSDLTNIKNWFIYIVIPIITFFLSAMYLNVLDRKAYNQYREDIIKLSKKNRISKYKLITILEDYDDLEQISESLKKDPTLE